MTKRIVIVGAGAAGLSAAVRLRDRGYDDVTVFEGAQQVGGKACSVEVDGRDYDLGAVVITPQYPNVLALADRYRVPTFPRSEAALAVDLKIGRLDGVGTDDAVDAPVAGISQRGNSRAALCQTASKVFRHTWILFQPLSRTGLVAHRTSAAILRMGCAAPAYPADNDVGTVHRRHGVRPVPSPGLRRCC